MSWLPGKEVGYCSSFASKMKSGSCAIQAGHGWQIEAADLRLSRSLERVMVDKHIEEKDRQREEIGLGAGDCFAAHDLRGHKAGGAANGRRFPGCPR